MQVIMNTEFDTKFSEVAKTTAIYTDSYLDYCDNNIILREIHMPVWLYIHTPTHTSLSKQLTKLYRCML